MHGAIGPARVALAVALLALVSGSVRRAEAHPLSPVLLELRENADGRVQVAWKTSILKVPGSNVRPLLPEQCPIVGGEQTTETADSVIRRWSIECGAAGLVGRTIAVDDLAAARSDALVRLTLADGRTMNFVLRAAAPSIVVPERARPMKVALDYARLGIEHILGGPDHLLFVFGLVLLVRGFGPLVKTVTAFTVGHSITLTLAVLGFVHYPTQLIELLIALSVFVLAVELTREEHANPTLMRRFPWMIAGCFGLLHGLGFAGALSAVGLPAGEIPVALLTFNVGIELGQLTFVLAVVAGRALVGAAVRSMPVWARRVPLYAMGSLSALWCFERAARLF